MSASGPAPFALLGRPVEHSLSPRLHRRAIRALGRDACYAALDVTADELPSAMRALARSGGGGNVTIPHKGRAARALDRASEAVRATGSCNTFWGDGEGGLAGDNTDPLGFREAVGGLLPGEEPLAGRSVLVLGAGGGSRAVVHACLGGGAASVDVWNRTTERARRLAERFGDDRVHVIVDRDGIRGAYDLAVNATSLGLEETDPLPLPLDGLEVGAVHDLVYGAGGTAWTAHARRLGVPALDGTEMLVRQAAAALRRWFGEAPPLEVLRDALEGDV